MPRFNMCETCWLEKHPPTYGMDLTAFRGIVDICHYCGKPNRDGIYVRTDKQPVTTNNEPPPTTS